MQSMQQWSKNWGLARITLGQKQFPRIPVPPPAKPKPGNILAGNDFAWPYENADARWKECLLDDYGEHTTIYIVDENGYRTDDFVRSLL
jgi:hypothetical protein